MINSVQDPSKERYALVAHMDDFNLVYRADQFGGDRYSVAETQVSIAVQFEHKNFDEVDRILSKLKVDFAQKRIAYLDQMLNRVKNTSKSQIAILTEIFQQ